MRLPRLVPYLVAAAVVALLAAAWQWHLAPLHELSLKVNDLKYQFQPADPGEQVVFVAVDEKSVNRLGRWPWPRSRLAEGLARLEPASVVLLDMVFSESAAPSGDRRLTRTIGGLGNAVCGFFLRRHATEVLPASARERLSRSTLERLPGGRLPFPELAFAEVNTPGLLDACTLNAAFSTIADADGLFRRYPVGFVYRGQVFPSLAVQALRLHHNRDLHVTRADGRLVGTLQGRSVAIDDQGMTPLNFYPRESYRTVSFVDVLEGRVDPATFRDRLVLVGITEAGLSDIRSTPEGTIPGALVHYTFLANFLQGDLLRPWPAADWAWLVLLGVLPAVAVHRARDRVARRLLLYAAGGAAFAATVAGLYAAQDLWLEAFYPALALLLSAALNEALLFRARERESRFISDAFGAYLSPELVKDLTRHPERLELGGETRELTVLFSDIRGFTRLSESLPPDELVNLLNDYFTPVTRAIQAEGGYVDKFIGDAVMALFNAPVTLPDHPDAACRAACAMLDALTAFNAEQQAHGRPTLDIGIGIHTGEAVVGNMGSAERLNYTALGDSVNVASRLEGLTKAYDRRILLTGTTRDRLQGEWETEFLGSVQVKGREQPVSVFTAAPIGRWR